MYREGVYTDELLDSCSLFISSAAYPMISITGRYRASAGKSYYSGQYNMIMCGSGKVDDVPRMCCALRA